MKRLSFRFVRRAFLILALLFPIVYLTGSFFFALNGSNGNQLFAEPVYTEQFIDVDSYSTSGQYSWYVPNADRNKALVAFMTNGAMYSCPITFNGVDYIQYGSFAVSSTFISIDLWDSSTSYFRLGYLYRDSSSDPWSYSWQVSNPTFYGDLFMYNGYGTLSRLFSVPTEYVPENNSAFTDFIFTKPFSIDNFITELGVGVIEENASGFEPFRNMLYWFNDNMLGVTVGDGLGCFGLGYCYYALNVFAIYELVVLVVMVFTIPLKLTDRFTKEV